jgi:hypothetical protein
MVIGNRVMIDGKEVILDSDDHEAYYSDSSHSQSVSSLSTTPTTTPPLTSSHTQALTPTNDEYIQNGTYNHITNDETLNHTTNDATLYSPPTSTTDAPQIHEPTHPPAHHPAQAYIVHDNVNEEEEEEEIPEEINAPEEGTSAPAFTFRAEADMPEDLNN